MKIRLLGSALIVLLTSTAALSAPSTSATTPTTSTSSALAGPITIAVNDTPQKKQIETIVHDYIIQNPEIVVQSLQNFQQKQYDQAQKMMDKTRQLAPKYTADLFKNANDPVAGNPNGKITVVEFFDYQCPHCSHMKPILDQAIKSNPDLRVVYKEFPIRGPVSETASRAALAAKIQGKYNELHEAILAASMQNPLSDDVIYGLATKAGLDLNKLKTDMKSQAITDQLQANNKLGQSLLLMGTPAMFVAKTDVKPNAAPQLIAFIPGYVDSNNLQTIVMQITKQ